MNEQRQNAGPTVEAGSGEKHSAIVTRGISMPAHQVRIAIGQAVARGQVSEEDGEEVWWLYNYAQENHLKEADLAAKMKAYDKNTLYQLFRGSYGVSGGEKFASWSNIVKTIREFKSIEIEEMKKKNIGIIDTEVKQTVWRCCDAALNDGMVSFIYGNTQIGKSTCLRAYQREHNHGQTIYIEMGSGWTRARFVRELARKFGNGVKATKAWALEDAIFDTLTRRNLLIVDEFHKALTTTGDRQQRTVLEFIRDIRDQTGCGLVLCATKVGMENFETGANRLTFNQLIGRSIIKAVLPDRPPVRDLNAIARAFGLPVPQGDDLRRVKELVRTTFGLSRLFAYLQKTYAMMNKVKQPMTWAAFAKVMNGYLALENMKTENY
ncbi:MAG: ATP-binding protein [Kiritimatiellae bacterium]|nr:ATP-binding protein [Kiritimatiellia bacterium]